MKAAGQDSDFAAFYLAEFDRIVASIRRHVGGDAEDVAQEAFFVAASRWEEVSLLDIPAAWVRRVAIRIGVRRAGRERRRLAIEEALRVANLADRRDLDLAEALLGLPERHAAVIQLHHLEDRPVAEVAQRLGCSVAAAKVLLFRARTRLAERLTGLSGEWVSERAWSPDAIAAHLRGIGAGHHIGPVLEQDLRGRGGRWELSIGDGSYQMHRDDGKRLDHGTGRIATDRLELKPTLNTGRAVYRPVVDGQRLHLRLVDTSIPGTLGVPDEIWISLFLESGPFVRRVPVRAQM